MHHALSRAGGRWSSSSRGEKADASRRLAVRDWLAVPTDDHVPQDELTRERAHLAASRAALRAMRDRTASLEAHGGDRISTEFLKLALYRRMKALEDDPDVPLFFGRLDLDPNTSDAGPRRTSERTRGERFYIGRRHVNDDRGEPLVIDWRASMSRPFYRASRTEPMGVRVRRRFGFQHGELTAIEDETLAGSSPRSPGPTSDGSSILEAEIERPRTGPMRDIVATIQPEQDDIVRADLSDTVCVQGAPGTGKTAVGLHRAAYLLYAHRDQLTRQGVLVVGPNASFLRYIADVLPALGEIDARQSTIEDLVSHVPVRGHDDAATARIKGDERMHEVLSRALWSQLSSATDALVVPRGVRRWRVPAYQADEIVMQLRGRGVRYGAGRSMLAQRFAHTILVKMEDAGEAPDDRVQEAVARSRPVKAYVDALWPVADAKRILFRLFTDADYLRMATHDVLNESEQALLSWTRRPPSPGRSPWSLHDAVLLDDLFDQIDRVPSLGHVVVDEAQDLSPMMLRAVGRRFSTGSGTVLGDLAQATTPWGATDWSVALADLGKPDAHLEELTVGFRVPGDVLEYAAQLLPLIAPALAPPQAVRRARGQLEVRESSAPLAEAAVRVRALVDEPGSIGLIVPDTLVSEAHRALDHVLVVHSTIGAVDDIESQVDVVPAALAKGLEFDHVVLVEPAAIVAGEPDETTGLRRLYVCLTRAVTSLFITHATPIPVPPSA
jgi:DNA helicase IV